MTSPIPIEIKRRDDGLLIRWSEDHEGLYPARDLRIACPCAECREEFTGRLMLDPDAVPRDIRPDRVELVGGYGFRIYWSDGHHTGIFTYGALLESCPCQRCRGGRPATS